MSINPKILKLSLAIFYAIILTLWIARIYKHYFEFGLADQIALFVTGSMAIWVGHRFLSNLNIPWSIAITLCVGLPLAVFQMISELMVWFSDTWIWLQAIQILAIFGFFLIRQMAMTSSPILAVIAVWFLGFKFYPAQVRYYDRVIDQQETRSGNIHVVKWKNDYWLHYNNVPQFSTLDAHMYGEALTLPAMSGPIPASILIIGGENLLALHELSKFDSLKIFVHAIDQTYLEYMQYQKWHPYTLPTFQVLDENPFQWLSAHQPDLILLDLAEMNLETNAFFSEEFFKVAFAALPENGRIALSTGDPYLEKNKWLILENTLHHAGFSTISYHAQIPTIGESGFVLGHKHPDFSLKINPEIATRWLNEDAMKMMLSFGKKAYFAGETDSVNTIKNPSLIRYGRLRP